MPGWFRLKKQQAALHAARIEDYALIGDCQTAALVSREGSIDWLCWPAFSSGACFAALLGTRENGFWQQPKQLKSTTITLCVAAIAQGWCQAGSNGANLNWG